VLVAAARRFALLLGGLTAAIVLLSALLGLAFGSSLARAVSLGFYLTGAFLLVAGFFLGNRGPARMRGQPGDEGLWGLGRRKGVRLATPEEQAEAVSTTTIFVTVGVLLILIGVAADSRYSLY
jgi:hypothetical protein